MVHKGENERTDYLWLNISQTGTGFSRNETCQNVKNCRLKVTVMNLPDRLIINVFDL
jgi:hypothetical protein